MHKFIVNDVGHTIEQIFHPKNVGYSTVGAAQALTKRKYLTSEVHIAGYDTSIRFFGNSVYLKEVLDEGAG